MPDYSAAEKDILDLHSQFWNALADRDIDLRLSFCKEDITIIGTGLHERVVGKAAYMTHSEKGKEQLPGKFRLEMLWTDLTICQDTAWVEMEMTWERMINNKIHNHLFRSTTIFRHEQAGWIVAHVHISAPDYRLSEGKYWTNDATIQRNAELERQVYERTHELNRMLVQLQSTQAQLIQSEKMASLGELTAGIAHEIQNPLNFVNNFSELNKELLAELKDEIDKGNLNEANTIANDVIENQEKINQHGKRADAIVKGMLQHSRISTGQKELTDINALAEEYLRLAYHGLRAKDKTFNAKFETNLDPVVGKINIVPQEIGRVILNLINNAFYSVSEKLKQEIAGYEPTVAISTRKIANKAEIRVKDNGTGIPQKVADKIFQPFFTTKPAGQGTGLGLSLAYEIITKAHGGELKVETKEGEGAEFIVQLPA